MASFSKTCAGHFGLISAHFRCGAVAALLLLPGRAARAQVADTIVTRALQGTSVSLSAPGRTLVILDLTRALGPSLQYTSTAGWVLFGLDEGQRFQAGVGLRGSYFFAATSEYDGQNMPASQTLRVPNPRLLALNAAFHARVRVAGPVWVGGNFDFVGLSFGPERAAQVSPASARAIDSRPALLNLVRDGPASRGSLNSEAYAAVALPHGLGVRLGYSRAATAYTTNYSGTDADRYRRRDNLALLGVSYTLR